MNFEEISTQRLFNQQIAATSFKKIPEIVSWLGAMQAQEFAMAKWAIGLRLPGITDADVEKQFNDGKILRTHVLRPTWHFVAPKDIHWMMALSGPRVNAGNGSMYRSLKLDTAIFKSSEKVLEKVLSGKNYLTREEINEEFARDGIAASGMRLAYILMQAEAIGLICSGPRRGKQFTYALMDERVTGKPMTMDRDEALAELVTRFFQSRGPATVKDFVKWSGLTVKDAKTGLAVVEKRFEYEVIEGEEYIFKPRVIKATDFQSTFLMPDYDEYGMGYKDRSAMMPNTSAGLKKLRGSSEYTHWLVIDGRLGGSWERTVKSKTVNVTATPFLKISKEASSSVKNAVKRFATFVGNEPEEE